LQNIGSNYIITYILFHTAPSSLHYGYCLCTAIVHTSQQAYTTLLARLNTNKTLHIGEVGWASSVTEFNQTQPLTGTYSDYTRPVFQNKFTRSANLKEQSKYAAGFMLSVHRYHKANKAANLYVSWGLGEAYDSVNSEQLNVNGTAVYGLFNENRSRRDVVKQVMNWTPPGL
jgi:hypothetical protein